MWRFAKFETMLYTAQHKIPIFFQLLRADRRGACMICMEEWDLIFGTVLFYIWAFILRLGDRSHG